MRGSALSAGPARSHLLLPWWTALSDGRYRGGADAAPSPLSRPPGAAPWAAPEGGGAGLAGARRERGTGRRRRCCGPAVLGCPQPAGERREEVQRVVSLEVGSSCSFETVARKKI